jgi:superfamily II DNA or RNA helicase
VAYLPTGGGKNYIAAEITKMVRDRGKKVAFVCNRIQLLGQMSRVFDSFGISHGVIQGDNTRDPWSSVLLCSIQTVAKRGLPDVDLLILDECHACPGTKAYLDIMKDKMVIGLTATPYQKGMGMVHPGLGGPIFEAVVVGAGMRELINQGDLVDADIWAPADPDLSAVKITAGDYQVDQLEEAMNKVDLVGDIVSHWLRLAHGQQTMVFAVEIAHSKHICAQFVAAGVNAVHVDYRMTHEEKEAIYSQFVPGQITILCNCALLSEGADFPSCSALILARPTKSRVRLVQMFGRVLRPFPLKGNAIVLDHSGSIKRLGFPWDFSVTHLDTGKPKKASGEAQEKPEPLPKVCPQCQRLKPARTPKCPYCGFEATKPCDLDPVEGELVQLKGKKPKALQVLQNMGRGNIYGQLCALATKRGKGESWVKANYKNIFEQWPNRQEWHEEEPSPELLSWNHHRRIAWEKSQRRDHGPENKS